MNKARVEAFLGVPYASAMYKLHKMLLFKLASDSGNNICFRCGKLITDYSDLTVDHKESWLGISIELFWDLNNVSFSHHSCNSKRENFHMSEEAKGKLRKYHQRKRLSGN